MNKDVDIVARKIALQLCSLMAVVDWNYNRHEPCLVCSKKYMHHIDGLPCESDDNIKPRAPHKRPVNYKL